MATIGERLRASRVARGMSIPELEKRSGVSNAQISRVENAKRGMNVDTAISLARALDVDVGWLLEGSGAPDGPADASELEHAVAFLRGQLPDEFLDDALTLEFYQGAAWSRDQLVPMLRALYASDAVRRLPPNT